MKRNLLPFVHEVMEADRKMAFLSGPRQVGKTTLARQLQAIYRQGLYINWDNINDQKKILEDPYFFERADRNLTSPFLVTFDEIHKHARWKNYLKGVYDGFGDRFSFLVTGSGRLDMFKKGGDSLLGRYFGVPLFPLTVGEALGEAPSFSDFKRDLLEMPTDTPGSLESYTTLLKFSGFPEPFLKGSETFYLRWFQERKSLLLREDIRDTSRIRDVSLLEVLSQLMPDRVGSPLSINSLREDVGIAFETAREWLQLLESFYYLFRVPPWSTSLSRALKKETKAYLYDWVEVPTDGARFENTIALHLLKAVRLWTAMGQGLLSLHYVRDKEKRETDFLLAEKGHPFCLVECKWSDKEPDSSLCYFQDRLAVPHAIQLVHTPGVCRQIKRESGTLTVLSAHRFLAGLP